VKMFSTHYPKKIVSAYKQAIAKSLVANYLDLKLKEEKCSSADNDSCDEFQSLGLYSQFHAIMKDYPATAEVDNIFNAYVTSLGFNPVSVRADARRLTVLVKKYKAQTSSSLFLPVIQNEVSHLLKKVRNNKDFHFVTAWGIGVGRCLEISGTNCDERNFQIVSNYVKHVKTGELLKSWTEFLSLSGSQSRSRLPKLAESSTESAVTTMTSDWQQLKSLLDGKKHSLIQFNSLISSNSYSESNRASVTTN